MASRRFFVYDPYEYEYDPLDYYYTAAAPYNYPYNAYYQLRQPAPSRRSRGVSTGAEPAAPKPAPTARDSKTSFEIPVHGPDSDPEPERVLSLQDAVDELQAPEAAEVVDAEESTVATELPDSAESGGEMESITKTVVHATPPTQVEIDETIAAAAGGEAEAEAGEEEEEEEEKEAVHGDANVDVVDEPEDSDDAEGEWEMVTEEENERTAAPLTDTSDHQQETPRTASAGAGADSDDDGVDARKVMQMVAALCAQSTQQCAVMGALAERLDALERAVRRMADAESRQP